MSPWLKGQWCIRLGSQESSQAVDSPRTLLMQPWAYACLWVDLGRKAAYRCQSASGRQRPGRTEQPILPLRRGLRGEALDSRDRCLSTHRPGHPCESHVHVHGGFLSSCAHRKQAKCSPSFTAHCHRLPQKRQEACEPAPGLLQAVPETWPRSRTASDPRPLG